jgi:8-oxoguanine deaminase
VEAWLRCGPLAARDTFVAGHAVVAAGVPTRAGLDDVLRRHRRAATTLQRQP